MAATAPAVTAPPAAAGAAGAAAAAAGGPNAQAQVFPSASLYVGDLSPDINEVTLYEIFNRVGTVASIRVCRDAMLRRSLGYAYVNYHNAQDAERALDTLNFTPIKGKPCRVMWSHRDPSSRRNGKGNIFIKNLEKGIDNKTLYDTFSPFGNILSCKVATVMDGDSVKSLGHGFVHFETEEAALLAIDKVNDMLIAEKKVFVGQFVPRSERSSGSRDHYTNVYVKNIPKEWTSEQLEKEYSKYGPVQNAATMNDGENQSRGFGFVNFEKAEDAKVCVEESIKKKEADPEGIFPYVARAQRKDERMAELRRAYEERRREMAGRTQGANLYVKNLDDSMDDSQLAKEFTAFGSITSAKVMVDDTGRGKGFGFVCFANPEDATRAIAEMNGKMMNSKPLYVSLAQRREQRRQMLEQQYPGASMMPAQGGGPMGRNPMQMAGGPGPMFNGAQGGAAAGGAGGMQGYYQQGARGPAGGMPGQGMYQQGGAGMRGPGMRFMGQQGPGGRGPGPQGQQGYGNGAGQSAMMMGNGGAFPGGQGPRGQNRQNRGNRQQGGAMGPGGAPQQGAKPMGGAPAAKGDAKDAVQFTAGARNMGGAAGKDAKSGAPAATKAETLAALASASPEDQKQMLGEQLYPLVAQLVDQQLAGKVTGMLLEMDTTEVLNLIESPETELRAKVSEAVTVLQQAGGNAPAKAAPTEDRQALGERLFVAVSGINTEMAPKITGMLLETGVEQVNACLNEPSLLRDRVEEAMRVLRESS